MKKGSILLAGALMVCLLSTSDAEARKPRGGNYINEQGCLVVWEATYFLGIRMSYSEEVFCNNDGTPIQFDDNTLKHP